MREVFVLSENDHKQLRELWINIEVARTGSYLDQADAAHAWRNWSMGVKRLCDHYEVPPDADYDVDVDRGILTVDE